MNDIILNDEEAIEVLMQLGNLKLSEIRHNPILMNAINKMNRTYNYSASAGRAISHEDEDQVWYVNAIDKVKAIKAIRSITGWGLKESKDYVDARGIGNSYKIRRSQCNCDFADAVRIVEQVGYNTSLSRG